MIRCVGRYSVGKFSCGCNILSPALRQRMGSSACEADKLLVEMIAADTPPGPELDYCGFRRPVDLRRLEDMRRGAETCIKAPLPSPSSHDVEFIKVVSDRRSLTIPHAQVAKGAGRRSEALGFQHTI